MCVRPYGHFFDPAGPNVFLLLCHEIVGVEPAQQGSPVPAALEGEEAALSAER